MIEDRLISPLLSQEEKDESDTDDSEEESGEEKIQNNPDYIKQNPRFFGGFVYFKKKGGQAIIFGMIFPTPKWWNVKNSTNIMVS